MSKRPTIRPYRELARNSTPNFRALAELIRGRHRWAGEPDLERIRGPVLATWALESGWGHSILATDHYNFAGMKWHKCMSSMNTHGQDLVEPVDYKAWDGEGEYCKFASLEAFYVGYLHRLDNHPAYAGWREHAKIGGQQFIDFVGPIWFGLDVQANTEYKRKVRRLWETRIYGYLGADI